LKNQDEELQFLLKYEVVLTHMKIIRERLMNESEIKLSFKKRKALAHRVPRDKAYFGEAS